MKKKNSNYRDNYFDYDYDELDEMRNAYDDDEFDEDDEYEEFLEDEYDE